MKTKLSAMMIGLCLCISTYSCDKSASSPPQDPITQAGSKKRAESGKPPADMADILDRHNYWRSQVGVSRLAWSAEVAAEAQKWANQLAAGCMLKHSNNRFGENIGKGHRTPVEAVDAWAREKQKYVYGIFTNDSANCCSHYTQIVWKNTTELGCGMATCADGSKIWVCNYLPAGNYLKQVPY